MSSLYATVPADVPHLMTPTFTACVLDAFETASRVWTHDGTHLLD
jgi:hypothetical protein